MTVNPGEVPETLDEDLISPDSRTPDSATGFTELDLALVDALQAAPRAPWTRIGRALGVDATTAARRFERLRAGGLAWVTAYDAAKTATVAYVEVRCRPRAFDRVSAAVTALPWVFGVDETAGDFDLFLSVAAPDLPSLGRAVHGGIGGLRGVRSTRTRLGITLYGEGRDWRMRAMNPAERAGLGGPPGPHPRSYSTHLHERPGPQDQALIGALGGDGRLGYAELGARTGMSEHTARRRLQRMIRDGDISLRCDLAHPLAGLSTMVVYRTSVPHALLEQTGNALARLEQVRMCVSVSGPYNLLVLVWLHGLGAVDPFEALLAERFPALEVRDRTVSLFSRKRMGWLLDEQGRAEGRVPLGLPEL
ncbi:Lrp/AsnC family transcriptional regulator [Streptomyces gardneri]|uniref:AsnC family transcriptional regulator n=1 Tax=Streptomyces gardneri TaxID=66892 RepID=A0A4Y3RWY5_9ACTN|nr:Lrp/AsnC family transcriptional regulator [Streptomyces gardneri]GEB62216.1 AsnC family transcriptional regulator [Streptomyces gardneri]GHH23273.1 AsnC family transcriptional regulator [Streptomyces gardneri]